MRFVSPLVAVGVATGVLLSACGAANKPTQPMGTSQGNVIVGNDGELPFDKQYHLSIAMPMPEAKFIELLKRLHLKYSVLGDRAQGLAIPKPRLAEKPDEDDISRVYQVYGGVDSSNRFGRVYRAFVSKGGDVVYIENAFEYPGT